jgi:hypothetical protein
MKKSIFPILIVLLGLLLTGCQSMPSLLPNRQPLTLTIDQITPDGTPGQYALHGQTTLPEGTELIVTAVRPLISSTPEVILSEDAIPSTLARTTVSVTQDGRWQTQLQLWQISPEGHYQENWQGQDPTAALGLSPGQDVMFAATLSPSALARTQQKNLQDLRRLGNHPIFNVTPAGEPYLETQKTLTVPLPNSNLTATVPPPNPDSSLWVDRGTQNGPEISFTGQQSLPFTENDNLPIAASHRLQ